MTTDTEQETRQVSRAAPTLGGALRRFRRLFELIRPYWTKLTQGTLVGVLVTLLGLVTPFLMKLLFDEVYPARDVALLHLLVLGILAGGVGSTIMNGVQSFYMLWVNTRINNAVALFFLNHVQHLPLRFFERRQLGEIMSRFGDVRQSLQALSRIFQAVLLRGAYLLLVPPLLFFIQWKLTLVALVSLPFTTMLIALSGRTLRGRWQGSTEAYAALAGLQTEALSQAQTIKSLALEPAIFRQAQSQIGLAMRRELQAGALGQAVEFGNTIFRALNTALLTWVGWQLILANEMTLGDYIAFSTYITYLYGPLTEFTNLFSDLQHSSVNVDRMFEYVDALPEQPPSEVYSTGTRVRHVISHGRIAVEGVSFAYSGGTKVLTDVHVTFPAGSTTSIVGPSGSGKSTLFRLIMRLEEPSEGTIRIDSTPITGIPLPDLRKQIAVVWQETGLLRGTVWDNLTFGMDSVPAEVVYRATIVADIDDFIRSLPEGYQTPIAEFGATLSGGERQRLALARALIRGAPIILLDEVTANIDLPAESRILTGLLADHPPRTLVFITHRVAAAQHADQVCVMDRGRVVGIGRHGDLLRTCQTYKVMWRQASETPGPREAAWR